MNQSYSLNMIPSGNPLRIPVRQYDAGLRTIVLTLWNGSAVFTPPTGAAATVEGTKPDGKSFSYTASISGAKVTFPITVQMAAVAGSVRCQLTVGKSGSILGSATFLLEVEASALPKDPDLSQSELSALEQLHDEAITAATNAAASAQLAGAYHGWSIPHGAWTRYDTQVSTNVLAIALGENNTLDAVKNQPATIMTEDASTLTNSPVTSGGFWARRTVYPVFNPTGSEHITVELEEYEPVLGRRWLRTYYAATGKWNEKWREISPTAPLDQITVGTNASIGSYTTAGLYWLVSSTVTDTPNGGSGLLIVTASPSGNVIYQTFISYNTGNGYYATRCYTNSQWYGWDQRPAPADYVTSQGTSGAWFYRLWASGRKECWLQTSILHEIKQQNGSLYYSSTVPYPYPVSFTAKPTLYIGVRSPNNKPIWAIPSTPASGSDVKNNAYMEFMAGTSTDSISTDIYAYACGI